MDTLFSANAVPIDQSNKLRVSFWNADDTRPLPVVVRYQIEEPNGNIIDNAENVIVGTGNLNQTILLSLTKGKLLSVSCTSFQTNQEAGILFGAIAIQYGGVNDPINFLALISGYISAFAPLQYPLGDTNAVNQTEHARQTWTGALPGPGGEFNENISSSGRVTLTGGSMTFTTSAVAGNRTPIFTFGASTGPRYIVQPSASIAPSSVVQLIFWRGHIPLSIPTNVRYVPIPFIQGIKALRITSLTTNLDAADEYTDIFLLTETTAFT